MIAVHCGAGKIGENSYVRYKRLSSRGCRAGIKVLRNGGTALEAVRAAVMVLEDDPLCNAGVGSNLTTSGKVECDASVMDGNTLLYGGCGSVQRVKNPVALAYDICVKQYEEHPLGLIAPSLIVGAGALEHAKNNGLEVVRNKDLVTKKARNQLTKYNKILEEHNSEQRLDTVGAVCCDQSGSFAAASSSGGLLLKKPGRVGQGALYACGVWADSFDKTTEASVAACTSGCGEYLIQTQLAKAVCEDIKNASCPTTRLSKSMTDNFINSKYVQRTKNKCAGALVIHLSTSGEGSVLWSHNTETMSVGYMNVNDLKPRSIVSLLPNDATLGTTITVGGTNFQNIPSKN